MISIEERLSFDLDPDVLFAFLADFRNLPKWDPGIVASSLRSGEVRESGAVYDITSKFLGRRLPLVYETVAYDDKTRFAEIRGEGEGVYATDRIRVVEGANLIWQADFQLKGPVRLIDGLTKPIFLRLGKVAMAGLRRYVASGALRS